MNSASIPHFFANSSAHFTSIERITSRISALSIPHEQLIPLKRTGAEGQDLTDDPKPVIVPGSTKTKGKRKQTQEKTPSPPKKRKVFGPLLSGSLDQNVHVPDRLQFKLTPEEKKTFKEMSPSESLNMAYELMARASVCLNYSVGTTKPLLVSELETAHKDLATTKKEISSLTERLEKAQKSAEDDQTKAADALLEAQNEVNRLKQSIDTLTLDLQKSSAQTKQVTKERNATIVDRVKLAADYSALEDEVCEERQRGFEQGIAQCHHFFTTPLEHEGFDIMKVLVDDQLDDLSTQLPTGTETTPLTPVSLFL